MEFVHQLVYENLKLNHLHRKPCLLNFEMQKDLCTLILRKKKLLYDILVLSFICIVIKRDFIAVKKTRDNIDRMKFKVVPRPPNSTNLALNELHFFLILKESILGIQFDFNEKEIKFVVLTWLRNKSKEFYVVGFHTWTHRLEKCTSMNGDCVKKYLNRVIKTFFSNIFTINIHFIKGQSKLYKLF